MLRLAVAGVIACTSVAAFASPWGAERAGHERVFFTGFSVTPPPGDDWFVADRAMPSGQSTPKAGYGTGFGDHSTALALVYPLALPACVKDPQEMLKQAVASAHRGGPRTHVRSATSEFTTLDGATCIRALAIADDTGVRGHEGEIHTLTKWNLFCLHPQYPSFLVDMDYSERLEPGLQSPIPQAVRDGFLNSLKFERLERRIETIEVGGNLLSLIHTADAVWVTSGHDNGTLVRIDPRSNAVVARIPVGQRPGSVIAFAGAVWVVNTISGNVMRIDPATNKVTATVAVGKMPAYIAGGFGSLWVTNNADGTVTRIDPGTLGTTVVPGLGQAPMSIVTTQGGVFVSDPVGRTVVRIDPATNTVVQTLVRGVRASYIIADGATLWGTDLDKGIVVQIATGDDARILRRIDGRFGLPGRIARVGADLWVTDSKRDEIIAFDLSSGDPKPRRLPSAAWPLAIVEGGGAIWVASSNGGVVLRLDPA